MNARTCSALVAIAVAFLLGRTALAQTGSRTLLDHSDGVCHWRIYTPSGSGETETYCGFLPFAIRPPTPVPTPTRRPTAVPPTPTVARPLAEVLPNSFHSEYEGTRNIVVTGEVRNNTSQAMTNTYVKVKALDAHGVEIKSVRVRVFEVIEILPDGSMGVRGGSTGCFEANVYLSRSDPAFASYLVELDSVEYADNEQYQPLTVLDVRRDCDVDSCWVTGQARNDFRYRLYSTKFGVTVYDGQGRVIGCKTDFGSILDPGDIDDISLNAFYPGRDMRNARSVTVTAVGVDR